MRHVVYLSILALGLAGLVLATVPGAVSAHNTPAPVATPAREGPTFSFPSNGQSFPLNGAMLFQVQAMSGAKGYLWSFVQGRAVIYQNLAWEGHLDGATYNIRKGSAALWRLHGGAMQVWVRAWMGGSSWSATSSVTVQLIGGLPPGSGTNPPSGPPAPGTVLYQANWSNGTAGWLLTPDWKTVSGQLVNDGTNRESVNHLAHPPAITRVVANYAVETSAQIVRPSGASACGLGASFGITVRQDSSGDYHVGIGTDQEDRNWYANIRDQSSSNSCLDSTDTRLAHSDYSLDNAWHTFRVEVRGNNIKILVDGSAVLETTDNHHLTGNNVGLWSTGIVLNVRSFKVIAL